MLFNVVQFLFDLYNYSNIIVESDVAECAYVLPNYKLGNVYELLRSLVLNTTGGSCIPDSITKSVVRAFVLT